MLGKSIASSLRRAPVEYEGDNVHMASSNVIHRGRGSNTHAVIHTF
jgi:hypothetical protein